MRIRLKEFKRKEEQEQTRKVAELLNIYKVPTYPSYNYQPIGASSFTIDPQTQKIKGLFQMFGLIR